MGQKNEETPKVCIIGAGFAGLCAAIQLKKQLGLQSFTVFDSNEDVGGTWLVSKYPGCVCDIQSHLYSYSFEKNPDWSLNYAPQPEILEYLKKTAQKYDIYRHARFRTDVKVMKWDESIKKWRVTVEDKSKVKKQREELLFDIVINGVGPLRAPNYPEEFKAFKGPLVHTGEWDTSLSWENKIVAVIGSGSSAGQIIPALAPKVKTLHAYQRKPAWVIPKKQFEYPKTVRLLFTYVPGLLLLFRAAIFFLYELFLNSFYYGNFFSKLAVWQATSYRKERLNNYPELAAQLTPNYAFGCKRIVPSDNYYEAMARPNVQLHREEIQSVTSNSIITKDGHQQTIDIIVLATGYKYQDYFAPMQVFGQDGANIWNLWKQNGPQTYYGMVSNNLPNQFFLLGPNTIVAHISVVFQIECQANFVVSVIREFMARNAKSVTVKASAEQRFMSTVKDTLKKTVWGNVDCGSWFLDSNGRNTTLWPKTVTAYWNETRTVDFNAFEFS